MATLLKRSVIRWTYDIVNKPQSFCKSNLSKCRFRIIKAINKLPAGDVKKMQGMNYYRLRVGDFRVIFSNDGTVLMVEKIGNRGEVYKD